MDQNIVHRHVGRAQLLRARQDLDLRKVPAQPVDDRVGIRIDEDLINFRNDQQGLDDVMKERPSCQQAVVFPWHSLAVIAHGNESNKLHSTGLYRKERIPCKDYHSARDWEVGRSHQEPLIANLDFSQSRSTRRYSLDVPLE